MTILVLLGIVAIAALLYGLQTLVGKSAAAADRAIRRKTLEKGRVEATTGLQLSVPLPPEQVIEAIVQRVNAFPSAPPLIAGLYLKSRSDTVAQFAFGAKASGDRFNAVVKLSASSGRSQGRYDVSHWTEYGADVAGRSEITRLRTRIEAAVRSLSGVVEPD